MSDGKLLYGQQYLPEDDLVVRFTQQMREIASAEDAIGRSKTEVTPQDAAASLVREYNAPDDIDTYCLAYPSSTNFSLPDVLESIAITFNKNVGDGEKVEGPGYSGSSGRHGSMSLTTSASSQASASIIPDAVITIRQTWAQNVPTMRYVFYMFGNTTMTQMLSKLNSLLNLTGGAAIHAWPNFKPKAHTLTLKGQQVSVSSSSTSRSSFNWDISRVDGDDIISQSQAGSSGGGFSRDVGVSIKSVRIPPTIHGVIPITPTGDTITATSSSQVSRSVATGDYGLPSYNPPVNEKDAIAEASVYPTSLPATSPASIPTSGLYLLDVQCRPWRYGYTAIQAEVVDFSYFV